MNALGKAPHCRSPHCRSPHRRSPHRQSPHRRRTWLAVSLVSLFVGAAGCNSILGIEEAQLSKSTGGSGGMAGSGNETGGRSSSGGRSSGGASSGGSSTGGSAPGNGGAPAQCDQAEESSLPAGLVSGCVYRASCDPLGSYTISSCLTYGLQHASAFEECTYGATSCRDIEACIARAYVDVTEAEPYCDPTVSDWACEGDVAIFCGSSDYSFVVDCPYFGGSCSPYAVGATGSGTPPCAVSWVPCDDAPGEYHCDGTYLYECIDGVRYGSDCSLRAASCDESTPGEAYCVDLATPLCEDPGTTKCSGGTLTSCSLDGYELAVDCGEVGLSCSNDDYCLAPGCTTKDADKCVESCEGTSLSVCVGGAPLLLDCTEYGFDGCATWGTEPVHAYCFIE